MIYRRSFTAAGFGLALKRSSVINPRAIYRFDYDRKWSALVEPGNNSEANGTDELDVCRFEDKQYNAVFVSILESNPVQTAIMTGRSMAPKRQ